MSVINSPRRAVLASLGLMFLIGVFAFMGFGYYLISPADKNGADRVFSVREGSTLKEVTVDLERKGLIRSGAPLLLWARVMGYGKRIHAGEYRFNPRMSPLKMLEALSRGAVITHPVTIPEGFTNVQVAELLAEKGLAEKQAFLSVVEDPAVAKELGVSGPDLEGYLYPDTYLFSSGLPPDALVKVMVKRFREVTAPFQDRILETKMDMAQVVTLASIVEKETGLPEERPIIASVFLNRLEKGMRLASDPTVIYGIKDFNGNLTRKDLTKDTPYNTYVIRGLPPGPIANPGIDSIKAVLNPSRTDYLYFVSKNDGSHYFSKTFLQHARAVQYYQKKKGPKPKETP